jgi:hypothetical protein
MADYILKPKKITTFWKMTPCVLLDRLTSSWNKLYFSVVLSSNSGLWCLSVEVSGSHTLTHTTVRTPLNE